MLGVALLEGFFCEANVVFFRIGAGCGDLGIIYDARSLAFSIEGAWIYIYIYTYVCDQEIQRALPVITMMGS